MDLKEWANSKNLSSDHNSKSSVNSSRTMQEPEPPARPKRTSQIGIVYDILTKAKNPCT